MKEILKKWNFNKLVVIHSTKNFYGLNDYGHKFRKVVDNKFQLYLHLKKIWEGEFSKKYNNDFIEYLKTLKEDKQFDGKPSFGFGTLEVELEDFNNEYHDESGYPKHEYEF